MKMVRLKDDLHKKLKTISKKQGMVFERFIEMILENYLKANGK